MRQSARWCPSSRSSVMIFMTAVKSAGTRVSKNVLRRSKQFRRLCVKKCKRVFPCVSVCDFTHGLPAVVCVESRTVIQLLTYDLVTVF